MPNKNIIQKLKQADLRGRGGASFPTYIKWQTVLSARAKQKYVVANGSEGEPETFKDAYILEHYPEVFLHGLIVALDLFSAQGYIYLNKNYYKKYKNKLQKLIPRDGIIIFEEKGGYLSGEETTVCQEIEHKIPRPRIKPPLPGQFGIYGFPTLINNIETFYQVARIAQGKYKNTRFYTIAGNTTNPGVYELPLDYTVRQVLAKTANLPDLEKYHYFFQVGGGASGEILLPAEIDRPVSGSGSIIIYDQAQVDPYVLLENWLEFFRQSNCDKCTPCREGLYRLSEMIKTRQIDKTTFNDLIFVMQKTPFCPLASMATLPIQSLVAKIL